MATFGPIAVALVKEGCTAEQIAAAVAALEAAKEREREERLARLRAGAAERVRRYRERQRQGRVTVTRNSAQPPFPLKERSPAPPKENNPQTSGESAPAPDAGRLPADFEPSAEDFAFGAAEGLSSAEIRRAIEDLRLWAAEAAGKKALRSDWHATLRRFMRRDADAKRIVRPLARSASEPFPQTFHVKRDSPQGDAWWAFVKARTGRSPPLDRNGGWRFPSEWPPMNAATLDEASTLSRPQIS